MGPSLLLLTTGSLISEVQAVGVAVTLEPLGDAVSAGTLEVTLVTSPHLCNTAKPGETVSTSATWPFQSPAVDPAHAKLQAHMPRRCSWLQQINTDRQQPTAE